MSTEQRIDEIVKTHHAYLRRELPILGEMMKAHQAQIDQDPDWQKLNTTFLDLRRELELHIMKEEVMLFPSILHIENAAIKKERPDLARHDIREALDQNELEHDSTTQQLEVLSECMRKLVESPQNQALFQGLEDLRKDLEEHIRKEDKELFPEARYYYSIATEGMLKEE